MLRERGRSACTRPSTSATVDIFTAEGDQLYSAVSYDRNGYDEESVGHYLRVDEYGIVAARHRDAAPGGRAAPDLGELSRARARGLRAVRVRCSATSRWSSRAASRASSTSTTTGRATSATTLDFLTTVGQLTRRPCEKQILLEEVTLANVRLHELVELGAVIWRSRDIEALVRQVAQRLVAAPGRRAARSTGSSATPCAARSTSTSRDGFDDSVLGRPLRLLDYPATAMAIDRREPFVFADLDDERLSASDRACSRSSGSSELCRAAGGRGPRRRPARPLRRAPARLRRARSTSSSRPAR